MNEYMVTVQAKLFAVNRVVFAGSKAEAAAKVDQTGAMYMEVTEVKYED